MRFPHISAAVFALHFFCTICVNGRHANRGVIKRMNAMTTNFDATRRFPNADEAMEYLREHDQRNSFKATADQGEFILVAIAPKVEPKAKKVTGKQVNPNPKGRKSVEARQAKAQTDAKAAKEKAAKPVADFRTTGLWHKLDDRKWIGNWAALRAAADAGRLPDAMGAKAERAQLFGGIFGAATHAPFEKRIVTLAALIRAKDEKGLKLLAVKEISTTPIMLGKLRDLAIAALAAKAEKPAKPAKAKAVPQADGAASEGQQAQA